MAIDMREHPSLITYHQAPLSSRVLSESAFTQPIHAISISVVHLPRKIRIRASNGVYLTVRDVLREIYDSLWRNITPTEFDLLSRTDKERATRAYENRCRRLRDPRACEHEKRNGMKLVDFLNGQTRFAALSNYNGPDSWVLKHL